MQIKSYPNCCGAHVVVNFGHTKTNGQNFAGDYKPSIEEVKEYLESTCTSAVMYQIIINEEQRQAIGKGIIDAGFKRRNSWKNPNHDSLVHLYVKIPDELKVTGDDVPAITEPSTTVTT